MELLINKRNSQTSIQMTLDFESNTMWSTINIPKVISFQIKELKNYFLEKYNHISNIRNLLELNQIQ